MRLVAAKGTQVPEETRKQMTLMEDTVQQAIRAQATHRNAARQRDQADNLKHTIRGWMRPELAKDLDVKLEFVATDWKTLVSGVVSGKYHMTGSASISPARAKAALFQQLFLARHRAADAEEERGQVQ